MYGGAPTGLPLEVRLALVTSDSLHASCASRALLLAASLAAAASPLAAAEVRRVAVDAAEIRIDYPQLFRANRIDMEARPKSSPGEFVGSSRQPRPHVALYDFVDGRIVFVPARQYMPKIDGLTAEGISLRRDLVRFKYSFK